MGDGSFRVVSKTRKADTSLTPRTTVPRAATAAETCHFRPPATAAVSVFGPSDPPRAPFSYGLEHQTAAAML